MTSDRWQQVEALYQAARGRAPAERNAFLDKAAIGDAELRREVETLLAGDAPGRGSDGRILPGPAADSVVSS